MKNFFVTVILLSLALPSISQEHSPYELETGNDLIAAFNACDRARNTSDTDWATDGEVCWHLHGYIEGVTTATNLFCSMMRQCQFEEPAGVTNGQLYDVIRQYLTSHASTRQEPSQVFITSALIDAWPKPKTN